MARQRIGQNKLGLSQDKRELLRRERYLPKKK